MGIDNSSVLFFGFFVERDAVLEWLQDLHRQSQPSSSSSLKNEDSSDEDSSSSEEELEQSQIYDYLDEAREILFPLTGDFRYDFALDTASESYDLPYEDLTYFFGITFDKINVEDLKVLIAYEDCPGYSKIKDQALKLGATSAKPAIYSIPHVY